MKIINQPRNKTRYDNNLTIMKSPKPATDNRFKWTLCIVTNWWPFWKWRPVEICWCQESIQDIIIYLHMKCRWNWTMLNFWGIVVAILKMATGRNFSRSGINSGHHYLPTYFLCRILAAISKFWKRILAPLMVSYHYVKFYVSIIIHLEVININVRNFNFSIGFYCNPLWTPQNITLTPFIKKL